MDKVAMVLLLCLMNAIATLPVVHGVTKGPQAVKEWFKTLPKKAEKVTNLDFYLHDTLTGKTPSAVPVIRTNASSLFSFGTTVQIDDPLTVGPELNSTEIGRAQGFYSMSGLDEFSLFMSINLVFTGNGRYNGSTLSVLGRNPLLREYREMPVVGGTGVFRLARGTVSVETYTINATSGDAILHYSLSVLHY